jgi:hypothetical protein
VEEQQSTAAQPTQLMTEIWYGHSALLPSLPSLIRMNPGSVNEARKQPLIDEAFMTKSHWSHVRKSVNQAP